MKSMNIERLPASFADEAKALRRGEEIVLVTSAGERVARVVPIREETEQEWLDRMVAEGVLTAPKTDEPLSDDWWDEPRPEDPAGLVRAAIIEERRTGR